MKIIETINSSERLARANVRDLSPFAPPPAPTHFDRLIKLDANESMLGPSQEVLTQVQLLASDLAHYPDPTGYNFKRCLADRLDIEPAQITLGNGSNDVLEMIARVFTGPGDEAIFSQFAFAVYPIVTKGAGAVPVMVPARDWGHDLNRMLDSIGAQTKIVFFANPNNPTGTWFDAAELEAFLENVSPNVIVVLDEAYFEYSFDGGMPDGTKLISRFPNLIVTRTFSKAYGLAALRIGYAVSHPDIAGLLNRIRQPFNVNRLGLGAAEAALIDEGHLHRTVELTTQGMQQLIDGVAELGLSYIPSRGNYLCINVGDGMSVVRSMAAQGIMLCPLANYGMPEFVRVTIGNAEENTVVLQALSEVVEADERSVAAGR